MIPPLRLVERSRLVLFIEDVAVAYARALDDDELTIVPDLDLWSQPIPRKSGAERVLPSRNAVGCALWDWNID